MKVQRSAQLQGTKAKSATKVQGSVAAPGRCRFSVSVAPPKVKGQAQRHGPAASGSWHCSFSATGKPSEYKRGGGASVWSLSWLLQKRKDVGETARLASTRVITGDTSADSEYLNYSIAFVHSFH
jgi:hypothetical protein